jgi:hypothetical protein
MKIGEVDVLNSLLQLERDVKVLQKFVEFTAINNKDLVSPSVADIKNFQAQALKELQEKYPNMGIQSN